jgi:hypothetical protein
VEGQSRFAASATQIVLHGDSKMTHGAKFCAGSDDKPGFDPAQRASNAVIPGFHFSEMK